ncbi:UNVERIFIED_CONTAM: hypothetical protein K2H54_040531 [Gekko kuhli]
MASLNKKICTSHIFTYDDCNYRRCLPGVEKGRQRLYPAEAAKGRPAGSQLAEGAGAAGLLPNLEVILREVRVLHSLFPHVQAGRGPAVDSSPAEGGGIHAQLETVLSVKRGPVGGARPGAELSHAQRPKLRPLALAGSGASERAQVSRQEQWGERAVFGRRSPASLEPCCLLLSGGGYTDRSGSKLRKLKIKTDVV